MALLSRHPHLILMCVCVSAVDTMGNIAVSSGSHLYLEDGDIWVARWQADVEQLVPLTDREEVERYKLGMMIPYS